MSIRAIIINNEPALYKNISTVLRNVGQLEVIGEFDNAYEGLIEVLDSYPDVVFLGTEMEGLNGIELINIVKRKIPDIEFVFLAEDKKYAVKAFEVNALDYLLSPVDRNRLHITIDRIIKKLFPLEKKHPKIVGSFERLYFKNEHHSIISNIKWRTKKTEELFSYLLHNREKQVRTSSLVDLLWPHVNSKQGTSLLYSAIYQIRNLMKQIKFNVEIESSDGAYTLKLNDVHYDIEDWELAMDKLPDLTLETVYDHLQVIKLYKGDYLGNQDYFWAVKEREYFNLIWWHHVEQVANFLLDNEKYMEAIRLFSYTRKVCVNFEKSYFHLMKAYATINDFDKVIDYYKQLKRKLMIDFGASPNEEIEAWYNEWVKKNEYYMLKKS